NPVTVGYTRPLATIQNRKMEQIIGLSDEVFFSQYWEVKPYLAEKHFDNISDLFTIEKLNQLIDSNKKSLNYPLIRLAKNGKILPEFKTTDKVSTERRGEYQELSISKLNLLLSEGCTLILNAVERFDDNILELKKKFIDIFKEVIQVNLYLSQPGTYGFDLHYDPHEVFIIQIEGEKEWELFDFTLKKPLRNQRYFSQSKPKKKTKNITLKKGDVLYVPRGLWHKAVAQKKSSLHLTVGVYGITKFDIINQTIQNLENSAYFREYMRSPRHFETRNTELSQKEINDIIVNAINSLKEILEDSGHTKVCNDYHFKRTVSTDKTNIPFIY
ncbi:MAG: cupin-like domain-containing protein, partial [Bacteroidetes bacterium]|nr:cupin-like domain-containing protein [Bacteroidota bacterium]